MFEKVTESWAWTADTPLFSTLMPPLFILLTAPLCFFLVVYVQSISIDRSAQPLMTLRAKTDIRKHHRIAGVVVSALIAVFALAFGAFNATNWVNGDRETSGVESRSYLTFEGTIESSQVGGSTFFSDTPSELWLRAEDHPNLLLKINSEDDVAKFYERTDVESGKLYCAIPDENSSSLDCSSVKSEVRYDIEDPLHAPDNAEVKHTVESEEWTQD